MTREKIGEVYTDENGKARMSLDMTDITEDFTIEAIYDTFDDSIDFTNITYTLTLTAEETEIDTGDPLIISGELTGSDGSVIDDEKINIFANGQKIRTITISDGEYEETISNLQDGYYTIYAGFRNDRVVSESINITVGAPQITLTAEKQYINIIEESNSLILTGYFGIGSTPMSGEEIKIYDGSTLIDTKTTNANGGFEVPLSNISNGMHLYTATCGEIESEIFEVYLGTGDEVVIETISNTITFGNSEEDTWMDTLQEQVTIYFGDGTTQTVTDPVSKLTHTFSDNRQKHMVVLYGEDAIQSLGYEFLYGNTGVTNVIIGSNPSAILEKAFYGCTGLESIYIPNQIYIIGDSTFEGCTGLQTVAIEEYVSDIGAKAFYNCTSINEYKLFWEGATNIIGYDSSIFQTNLLTKFTVPDGQKNNYITKGYPSDRIEEGKIELTITADKQEYNMDDDVIVTITLKENGIPITWEDISVKSVNYIQGSTSESTWTTNGNGQIIRNLDDFIPTNGCDVDITVTYENVKDTLNIDGNIYKNSLQEREQGKWILKGSSTMSFSEEGLELLGTGDGAIILNQKLLKYTSAPITVEYDLINSGNGYSYLNYFFNENLEDKIFQLAKKPYGTKGTILDEYPNSNNWINTVIENNDHVKIKIENNKVKLLINGDLVLTKNNYSLSNFEDKLFSFATVQNSYAIYKNLKIAYEEEYNISLSTNKTIIDSGETATVTATIGDPTAKPNKKLHYQVKNGTTLMYEGDVITDNNGEASIVYTGTGAGNVDIIFTYFDVKNQIRIGDGAGKTQTIITLSSPTEDETFYSDETINIEGVLVDRDGNPLANKQIKIENNGE